MSKKRTNASALPPPAGCSSWLAYAVATMDDRSLDNDHDDGHQPQWPARVTRAQIRAAARAELESIEEIWSEMERALEGKIETTHSLADWAERALSKRETAEISANPEAVTWRGRDLSTADAIMCYRGRCYVRPLGRGVVLSDLAEQPHLDDVLYDGDYEVEIRVIRRIAG